jgi:hypothetical protein
MCNNGNRLIDYSLEWMNIFRAYLTAHDGKELDGFVELEESPEAIFNYFRVQAPLNNVMVIDHLDMIVAKMENGKLVFPDVGKEIDFTKTAD